MSDMKVKIEIETKTFVRFLLVVVGFFFGDDFFGLVAIQCIVYERESTRKPLMLQYLYE